MTGLSAWKGGEGGGSSCARVLHCCEPAPSDCRSRRLAQRWLILRAGKGHNHIATCVVILTIMENTMRYGFDLLAAPTGLSEGEKRNSLWSLQDLVIFRSSSVMSLKR